MKRISSLFRQPIGCLLGLALCLLLVPSMTRAESISQTKTVGNCTVTLRVLPPESYRGPHSAMISSGGAAPYYLDSHIKPTHHMVVFLSKDGKPIENAHVMIRYRLASETGNHGWHWLAVNRMYARGAGIASTHYGNNLVLAPGKYEVCVKSNGKMVTFHITV